MRIIYDYSHLGGSEILQVRYPECNRDIYEVITQIVAERTKVSREKTKRGQRLYAPSDMNRQFREEFTRRGYRELRDTYTITLPDSEIAIPGAFKQIDFVKDKVLIEIQFGKYFAMFYDMAKFQYFFNESKADVGVEIVPCRILSIFRGLAAVAGLLTEPPRSQGGHGRRPARAVRDVFMGRGDEHGMRN